MDNKFSYSFSADVVRVVAILGVVIIHVTNAVYTRSDFFGGATWWLSITLDSFSRISIPLFILLSGYLLLAKDESVEKSIKRILTRIAIPFIFWLLFYLWYGGGIPYLGRINLSIFEKIFRVDVYHLYFLVIIMGIYFVAPMIRSYLRSASSVSQDYFMKALLVIGMGEVLFQFLFHSCSENFFIKWVPYVGLFVAGYLLTRNLDKFKTNKLVLGYSVWFVATLIFNYLFYYFLQNNFSFLSPKGCLSHYTDYYLSINVVVMSVFAFLLLMKFQYEKLKSISIFSNLIKSIAKASFGIYLIHPFIARFLEMQFQLAVDFSALPILAIISLRLVLVFVI